PSTNERIRAALALRIFPAAGAIPGLLDTSTIRENRHRVHIFVGTQRAYISDWELTAGGTGLVVAEVAKPITSVATEGVCLEVDARDVTDYEWTVRAGTLEKITGERFQTPDEWREWYKHHPR